MLPSSLRPPNLISTQLSNMYQQKATELLSSTMGPNNSTKLNGGSGAYIPNGCYTSTAANATNTDTSHVMLHRGVCSNGGNGVTVMNETAVNHAAAEHYSSSQPLASHATNTAAIAKSGSVASATAAAVAVNVQQQQSLGITHGHHQHPNENDQESNKTLVKSSEPQSSSSPARIVKKSPENRVAYDFGRLLGNGSFGIVCEARCLATGEQVAIKKVLQDPRYKNRELDIMKELVHPNIVELKDYFYMESCFTDAGNRGELRNNSSPHRFLNVVMEFIPDTVYRVLKTFVRSNQPLPMLLIRLYTYQLCRSLGYLHSLGVCHRDIKPQNLLVNPKTHVLKLCDFGSAKRLMPSEHSVAYICSRFYRAPELMLGATEYTTAIDLWSVGCVLGELLLGRPLFSGETSVDQLVKIIQVLGTPSQKQMQAMNPNSQEFRFPDVRPRSWRQVMSNAIGGDSRISDEAFSLLDLLLKYEPGCRIRAYEALAHSFFDPLRDPSCRLSEGVPLPELFNFSEVELQQMSPTCREIVVPEWYSLRRRLANFSDNHHGNNNNTVTIPASNPQSTTYAYPLTSMIHPSQFAAHQH